MLDIIFGRDFTEISYTRASYTIIDLMSDAGGFSGTVTVIIGYFIAST
jgi:hypothetical protein